MKFFICTITLYCFIETISGAFIQCSRKDPKLNECLADKFQHLWMPNVDKAFPQFGIPLLDPHSLANIKITQGTKQIGLNFTASDVQFYGFKASKIQKVVFDPKAHEISLTYTNPRLVQLNKYEAKGKILLFPINGHGRGNITISDVLVRFSMKYSLVPDAKTKAKYVKVKSFEVKAKPAKSYMNFENLFNGDQYLSKQINDVINENSMELLPTFQPSVESALSKAWLKISNDFFSKVSYDDLFLP